MLEQFRENLNKRTLKTTQATLRQLNPRTQKAVLRWLDQVEEIRNDSKLTSNERSAAFKKFKTSPVVSGFVRDLVHKVMGKIPGKQKVQKASVQLTRFALPTLMNSEGFEPVADLLRKTFPMNQTGDHHNPSPETEMEEPPEVKQRQQRVRSKARKPVDDVLAKKARRPGTRHH